MQSRFFGCVANAGSSAARGSCRQNGGCHRWLESTCQATIQGARAVAAKREGEAMKVLERLTLVPKDLAGGVVAHSQGLSTPEGSCRGQRPL
jgi:hypothetical protein